MSITNELREYFGKSKGMFTDHVLAIADRIDAEHEAKVSYWQGACYKDGYDEGFASADDWLGQHEDAMAEHGWVRLHKDAGSEYIHEHDKVDWRDHAGTWHENATVVAVCNDGCYVMDGTVFYVHKSDIRHHHAPTVEDVLRDVVTLCHNTWKEGSAFGFYDVDDVMKSGNIAEFAAKLRLAEGEDA